MKSKTALAIAILFIWLCCDTLYQVIKYHNRDNKHQLHRGVLSLVSELLFMPEDSNRESKTLLPFQQQNQGNFVEELSINNTHLSLAKNTTLLLAQNNLSELVPLVDYHMKKHMKQGERKQPAATRVKICICALTRSKITWNTLEDSRIIKNVVASTYRTTSMQWDKFEVQILVGADSDDAFWLQHADSLEVEARNNYAMHLKFKFYRKRDNFLPFNDLMRDGYYTGSDYLLRINDDTEFTSSAWISLGVDTLKNFHPPNVGVVGPSCQQGNTKIMTHDMVHRTHLDIFKTYYPVVFHNWYIDNWISLVYGPNRTKKIKNWTVVHHVEQQGQRYKQVTSDSQWLQREVDSGSNTIRIYLKYLKNTSSHTKTTTGRNFFDFSAIVLTKNRPVDLLRLLKSIENTNFNGDKINLVIKVDKSIDNHRVIDVANNFSFTHGTKTVHISPFKKGLKNAWLNAWIPETKHERAIILEDDIELSPAWYTWLKDAWAKYKDHDSVMGISLCRETRIMKVPPGANYKREIVNNNNPYLYKFVGTWGYSLIQRNGCAFCNG